MFVRDVINCSTSVVRELDRQLIAEMNENVPNALIGFADLNVRIGSAVWPFVQPAAKRALHRAIERRGKTLIVNSAYRTIAQQLILYQHSRANRCGIAIAALPGRSNHQSGLAIDIEEPLEWRSFLEAQGWQWLGDKDRVHFDFKGKGIRDLRSTGVLAFQQLWNQNNPRELLLVDGIWGAKTADCLSRSPINGFALGSKIDFPIDDEFPDFPRLLRLTTPLLEGNDVREVQKALFRAGIEIEIDGFFGPNTQRAVKEFQQKNDLDVDGIVGSSTLVALGLCYACNGI